MFFMCVLLFPYRNIGNEWDSFFGTIPEIRGEVEHAQTIPRDKLGSRPRPPLFRVPLSHFFFLPFFLILYRSLMGKPIDPDMHSNKPCTHTNTITQKSVSCVLFHLFLLYWALIDRELNGYPLAKNTFYDKRRRRRLKRER